MGEVYRAHDTRLHRDVAVKVLPAGVAGDPDRLARFAQEARAAAALSHPGVMAVYDVHAEGDMPYVVTELLEGETLASALMRGALPQRRATDLAVEIALGLAAAHAKGIVHRDLKPSNIFITGDGRAKILDFGLAKLIEPAGSASAATQLPTTPATQPGVVLGTVGYMSPEQVRGEPADHRADIFAFGVVCYEMLSGQRAFRGDTSIETMAAILRQDPPEFARAVPPALERVIRRCLEKTPAQRFQSATDIAFALEALSAPSSASAALATSAPKPRRRMPAIAAAMLAGGAVIGALAARALAPAPSGPISFEARTFDRLPITNARFMPDGQTIVYSATPRGRAPHLYVINPNAEAPQPLGVTDAQLLAVSSKGELALITSARHLGQRLYTGTLARMTLGSSPRPVRDGVREADWSPDGNTMAIVHDLGDGRDRLEYPIGTMLHEASGYLSDPRVSPDGQSVAFFEHPWRFDDRGWVKVVNRTGAVTTLAGELFGLQGLAWTPDGTSVVFAGNVAGGSMLQPMSVPASGRTPARTVFGVPGRLILYDVARDGRWLAVREDLSFGVRARVPGEEGERDLSWLGSAGARGLSSDGRWLLMVDVGPRAGPDYGVVLRKTDGTQAMRLGDGSAQELSPDGQWAAALIATPPQLILYPTGTGEPIRLDPAPVDRLISASWFPDGNRLLVCGSEGTRPPRCYVQDRSGSPPSPLTPESVLATLAPDGRTLLLAHADGRFDRSSIEGGPSQPVLGLQPGDRPVGWSLDSGAVYVQQGVESPARVERIDLTTGQRSVVRQLTPGGLGTVAEVFVTDWVDDGGWYAYNYTSLPSTMFVVSGVID
jgi:eukaryotic-like serine/threonine-protein kinase